MMFDPFILDALEGMDAKQLVHASSFMANEATKDFTIITGDGNKVRTHKTILGLKSPVFAAMFEWVDQICLSVT